jgi:Flp pilus assembly protein TadB
MSTPSPQDLQERARQLRRALLFSWLLALVICVVLVVVDIGPAIIIVGFFVLDSLVLAIVARGARAKRHPSGLS